MSLYISPTRNYVFKYGHKVVVITCIEIIYLSNEEREDKATRAQKPSSNKS